MTLICISLNYWSLSFFWSFVVLFFFFFLLLSFIRSWNQVPWVFTGFESQTCRFKSRSSPKQGFGWVRVPIWSKWFQYLYSSTLGKDRLCVSKWKKKSKCVDNILLPSPLTWRFSACSLPARLGNKECRCQRNPGRGWICFCRRHIKENPGKGGLKGNKYIKHEKVFVFLWLP